MNEKLFSNLCELERIAATRKADAEKILEDHDNWFKKFLKNILKNS